MEHLDLTTLADRAGVPLEAARRYRDAYVLFIPAIRVGRTIGFPVEAVEVIRFIAEREAAGDDPWTLQAALEATYPVTVLSAQPIAPGDLASPHTAVLELLRGVDARYAALAAQVAGLAEAVAETVAGRPAEELAELRTMLATAQATLDGAGAAAQAAAAAQQASQTAIVDALAEQSRQRTVDQATILRAVNDLAAAHVAEQERSTAAHHALTTAQAGLAASTYAEHQALLTAIAAMVTSTHTEHRAILTAIDRQNGELAAIREQQAHLQTGLAAIQQVLPTLATTSHVEWLGAGLTQLGQRIAAQIDEHQPTGPDRDEMTARIATQTADGVGKLLDKREAALMDHLDAQLTALARHVESRVAQLDRRVSAIASMPGDGGPSQAVLLDRIAALTRQVSDEAILQNDTFERIASERDEATRMMGQLVADALATIQHEVRAGAATALAAQSAAEAAAERAVQAAEAAQAGPTHAAFDAQPHGLLQAPNGQPITTSQPAQRPGPAQTWTDHLVAGEGFAASGTPASGTPASGIARNSADMAGGAHPTVIPTPLSRSQPAPPAPRSRAGSTNGSATGETTRTTASTPLPPSTNRATQPPAIPPLPRPGPTDSATQPGLPNRRRLGHPLKPGDLTQAG